MIAGFISGLTIGAGIGFVAGVWFVIGAAWMLTKALSLLQG